MSLDPTVEGFFTKNVTERYAEQYRLDHSPRLQAMLNHFKLKDMKGQKVADVGGGLGFLGELIDPSNDYWVFDGAATTPETRVAKGTWVQTDLDHDDFGVTYRQPGLDPHTFAVRPTPTFDIAFCCETLEHCGNDHHVLVQIKKLLKPGGKLVISLPTETVTHNVPYPGLLWPRQNWEQFMSQMALPIDEFWEYRPFLRGWPAYHWLTHNADWTESKLLFPKQESKFRGVTPLQAANL